jgi:hypothetical protein
VCALRREVKAMTHTPASTPSQINPFCTPHGRSGQ